MLPLTPSLQPPGGVAPFHLHGRPPLALIWPKVVGIAIQVLKSYDSTNPRQPVDPSLTADPILLKVGRIAILLLESYGSTNPRQLVDPNLTVDPTRRDLGQFF